LEVIKKILIIGIILVTIPFGIYALLWGQVVMAIFGFFINSHYTGKFISYSAISQIKDLIPSILLAIIAGIGCYLLDKLVMLNFMDFIRILTGVLSYAIVYLPLSYLFQTKVLKQIFNLAFNR
jgi:teichuronic acid exporter